MSDLQTIYVSWHETVKRCQPEWYWPDGWPCVFKQKRDGAQKYHNDDKYRALETEVERLRKALSYCAQDPREMSPMAQAQFMIARSALADTNATYSTEGEGL